MVVRQIASKWIAGDVHAPDPTHHREAGCRIYCGFVRFCGRRPIEKRAQAVEQSHGRSPLAEAVEYTLSAYEARRCSGSGVTVPPPPADLHTQIVAALTEARREAKLRQVDLAKLLGWQQAYVSRYETGERSLSVDEYVAVALAIGIDPVELLKRILTAATTSV